MAGRRRGPWGALLAPILLLGGCGSEVDWDDLALQACATEHGEEECVCMVDRLTEQVGDEEVRLLAAFAALFPEGGVGASQIETLDMSAADFDRYRDDNARTLSRLRRSCTGG